MILDKGRTKLELVFDILRFRHRDNVTFRKLVILTVSPHDEWNALRDENASTQPLRVCSLP